MRTIVLSVALAGVATVAIRSGLQPKLNPEQQADKAYQRLCRQMPNNPHQQNAMRRQVINGYGALDTCWPISDLSPDQVESRRSQIAAAYRWFYQYEKALRPVLEEALAAMELSPGTRLLIEGQMRMGNRYPDNSYMASVP